MNSNRLDIDTYIRQFDASNFFPGVGSDYVHWFHQHPTVLKTIKVAAYTFSVACLASFAVLTGVTPIVLTSVGGVSLVASYFGFKALRYAVSPYEMSTHMYHPKKCEGGELYYDGDVPILSLTATEPYEAGKAHGYLLGDALYQLRSRWDFVLHGVRGMARPEEAQAVALINQVKAKIPEEYLKEMEGIVDGYNQWQDEQRWWFGKPKKITVDDMIFYHLLPDSLHFRMPSSTKKKSSFPPFSSLVGCTAIVSRNEDGTPCLARNMDWPSLDCARYTLVIDRAGKSQEVAFPGFVGALTGKNQSGLALAMNVCSGDTEEIRGMPASIFNRYCLDNCGTVQDVTDVLEGNAQAPLGPYHMTVLDKNDAAAFHMYQGPDKKHLMRPLIDKEPLVVTNCCYTYSGDQTNHMHRSEERDLIINAVFDDVNASVTPETMDTEKVLIHSLSLPAVNNALTTHKVFINPETGKMSVAFDNAYAGDKDLHEVHLPES